MRTLRLLAVAAAALLGLPASVLAQERVIDRVERPTPVSEYRGYVAWSRYDTGADAYRLVVRSPEGRRLATPVPDTPAPHDVDLGPDSDGRPGLAVSLCGRPRGDDGRSGGCDLFLHTLGTDVLRPVTNANTPDDESRPSAWRGTLAFVRDYGSGEPIVYTKPIVAPRSRPSTRQPGVPDQRCSVRVDAGDCTTRNRLVTALELYGRRLGQIVTYDVDASVGFEHNEVRLVDVAERSSELVALMSTGLGGQRYQGPSFASGRMAWFKTCLGDPGGCERNAGHFRYRYSRGTYERDEEREKLTGYDWTGRSTVQARENTAAEGRCARAGCPVVATPEPDWEPIDRERAL